MVRREKEKSCCFEFSKDEIKDIIIKELENQTGLKAGKENIYFGIHREENTHNPIFRLKNVQVIIYK